MLFWHNDFAVKDLCDRSQGLQAGSTANAALRLRIGRNFRLSDGPSGAILRCTRSPENCLGSQAILVQLPVFYVGVEGPVLRNGAQPRG